MHANRLIPPRELEVKRGMPDDARVLPRDFSSIQADLEAITAKLRNNLDPDQRRELLRQMRTLIQEATIAASRL